VQRLPIEPISQASANQRKGRSGRTSDGICIRLYSEEDFYSRPEYTDPEILRTNLASVILQMAAIGLGDIPKFPFIDPPDARNIADGLTLLTELNAFKNGRITGLGRRLARLPVDPRIGPMILKTHRTGCLGACRGSRQAAAGRVPRGPQRAVRHLPRLRPDQEAARLDRGRRAGGDVPAVGADGGAHRAGVGRAAGQAPGQAQLQRAALG